MSTYLDDDVTLAKYLIRRFYKHNEEAQQHFSRVAKQFYEHEMFIAALLHDIVEDGYLDHKQIKDLFGEEIHELVFALTRNRVETYKEYINRVAEDEKAILIKLVDLKDNLREPVPGNLKERYTKAFDKLTHALNKVPLP